MYLSVYFALEISEVARGLGKWARCSYPLMGKSEKEVNMGCILRSRSLFWASHTTPETVPLSRRAKQRIGPIPGPHHPLWAFGADCQSRCLSLHLDSGVILTALSGSVAPTWLHLAHGPKSCWASEATREDNQREARCQDITEQGVGGKQEGAEWTLHILNYQLLQIELPQSWKGSKISLIFHIPLLWRALWGDGQQ